jgi:hypothetical protein
MGGLPGSLIANGGDTFVGTDGTMLGGKGGDGGLYNDGTTDHFGGGGAGGNNRSGGGGGGGYNSASVYRPGKGGYGGEGTTGTTGLSIDIPYNLSMFAGGQLVIQITAGAGDASITLTW